MKTALRIISFLMLAVIFVGCQAAPTAAPAPAAPAAPAPTTAPVEPTQAPAPAEPAKAPAEVRPLVILASDTMQQADPGENWNFGGASYLPQVYDTLFRFVGESSPVLETNLAAEIPTVENGGISADGLTYTIKLNPAAKFHDGTPVNADAVIYSYQRTAAMQKGVNGITADWVKEYQKVDDTTVKFILKQPFSDFLNSMGSEWGNYIVNPAICKANEKDGDWGYAFLSENEAGSGPYKLSQYDKANNAVTLERAKDYWAGWKNASPIDKVIIRWLPDATGARPLLEKGDADIVVNMPSNDFAALEKSDKVMSKKYPSIMQYYMAFNGTAKPLDNVKVRQALFYSFDTDKVISDIFGGNLVKMAAAVGPGYPDVYAAKTQYTYDPEKAKALLKEAGFEKGLEVSVNIVGAMPNDQAVAEYWQADLAKIGVTLKINQVDNGVWSQAWFNDCNAATAPNIGQISAMGVGGDYPSAWEVMMQVFPTPRLGGAKCSVDYLDTPKVNELITKITNTTNAADRKALFQELYDTLADEAGALWLGQGVDTVNVSSRVKGYSYYFARGGNFVPLMDMSFSE